MTLSTGGIMSSRGLSPKQFPVLSSAGLLVVCLAALAGGAAQMADLPAEWNQPIQPFRIIGNIYYVGASDITSYLITTPEGHILLDSGFAETVPLIRKSVSELGFRLADVKLLLNSHAHFDHAGGLASLKSLTRARLVASKADAAVLARGGKADVNFGDRYPFAPVVADQIIGDGESIQLGGVKMTELLTPGHTQGNLTWTTEVKEAGQTYLVVFSSSPTVPGGYKLVGNSAYPEIVSDYRNTFALLEGLHPDVFLGTHGSFFGLKDKVLLMGRAPQNPFVDPDGFKRHLEVLKAAFEKKLASENAAPGR